MITETVLIKDLREGDEIEMTAGGFERIMQKSTLPSFLIFLRMADGSEIRIRPGAEIVRKL